MIKKFNGLEKQVIQQGQVYTTGSGAVVVDNVDAGQTTSAS